MFRCRFVCTGAIPRAKRAPTSDTLPTLEHFLWYIADLGENRAMPGSFLLKFTILGGTYV